MCSESRSDKVLRIKYMNQQAELYLVFKVFKF